MHVKSIKMLGAIVCLISSLSIFMTISFFYRTSSPVYVYGPHPPPAFMVYAAFATGLYGLSTGLGLAFLRKWGYYLFKLSLYLLLLGFPVGTLFSILVLRYLKRQKVGDLFQIN